LDLQPPQTRRNFIRRVSVGALATRLAGFSFPDSEQRLPARQARFPVEAEERWGRIEHIGDRVWALVSTPLEDRTTTANGGFVAGERGVVLIDSTATPEGARWLAAQATRLAGRPPTHLVLTHYHADHSGGLPGLARRGLRLLVTETTRDLVRERGPADPPGLLSEAVVLRGRRPTEIDLGDRSLILVPRRGHTPSDLSLEIPDARVAFCGDLVWNGIFPNYVDASPSRLAREALVMRAGDASTYVPGHGSLSDGQRLDAYIGLLDHVESAARRALERGESAEEAGAAYRLPPDLEDWLLFDRSYFAVAIGAWMNELRA